MPKRECLDMLSPFSFDGRFWTGEIEYKYRRLLTWQSTINDGANTLNTASYAPQVTIDCTVHYVSGTLTTAALTALINRAAQQPANDNRGMELD